MAFRKKVIERSTPEHIKYNLNRGSVEMMILDLVFSKDRSSLEIIQLLNSTDDGTIPDKTIYRILYRLEDEEYFSVTKDYYKGKIYSITPKGAELVEIYEAEYYLMDEKIKRIKDIKNEILRGQKDT